MIYVVLGMHKSGTTLVAEMLHASGINMVDDNDPNRSYDQGNKYERKSAAALNREILEASLSTFGFSSLDLPAPKGLRCTDESRIRIRHLVASLNANHNLWGFKDPRTCLTYPVWATELAEHRIIAIYRTPEEIWPRYRQFHKLYANPYLAWKFMIRWCEYNSAILKYLSTTRMNYLVLSYHELMRAQTEFERLQQFVGFGLSDRRVKSLRRNHSDKLPLLTMVKYFACHKTGCTSEALIERFDALRQQVR